jgi:riboflavin kinase/FMN adenylyltransferase
MEVLHSIEELRSLRGPIFAAIGVFDGVHLGHQAVISTSATHAREEAGTPVVITFDPHPLKVLRPSDAPHLLTATKHKIELIRALGVEHLLVIKFDREFANTPPEKFVEQLVTSSRPLREICVGHEWSFGRNRTGNLHLLRRLGVDAGFGVVAIPPVMVDGEIVSSTAIRRAVEQGDFARAAAMLGRSYTILGTVKEGAHLGKKLGFPTANLSAHSEQFPPNGVYATEAKLDGAVLRGVANVGYRPTVASGEPERLVELHLFDLDRDIYGEDIEVRFVKYLRPEQKFESLDALTQQIARDVEAARNQLSS